MAPSVRLHIPLYTTRIQFECSVLPPPPDITLRANLAEKVRKGQCVLPDFTLRADLTHKIRRKRHAARSPYERVARHSPEPKPRPREPPYAESREGSPLTSIDGSDDSEGEMLPPLPKSRQIPKPPGEAGRRNCGGFNLESALNWEGNKYKRMMSHIDAIIKLRLDATKSFTNQDQSTEKMKIQHRYIGDWPIREAYKQRLKYHSEMAKKKAHRKVELALVQAARVSASSKTIKQLKRASTHIDEFLTSRSQAHHRNVAPPYIIKCFVETEMQVILTEKNVLYFRAPVLTERLNGKASISQRRTFGLPQDSPDVESHNLDQDDSMQALPTAIQNPCYAAAAHPPVGQPIPPTTVHSPGVHGPPAELHTAEPYSSNAKVEGIQATGLLVPPNPDSEERRPRIEDRNNLTTHRHQRRSKTPRPNPVYEEPPMYAKLSLRLRNQLQQEFHDREANFLNHQSQILEQERTRMEDQIRKHQEHAAQIVLQAKNDADALIRTARTEAEQIFQERRTSMLDLASRREQDLLEKLRGAEEDLDSVRRGANEYAEMLQKAQAEVRQARLEADESRAEAERMRLELMRSNVGHRGAAEEQEHSDKARREKGKAITPEISDTEDEIAKHLMVPSSQPQRSRDEDDDMGLMPSSSETILPAPSSPADSPSIPRRPPGRDRDKDDDMGQASRHQFQSGRTNDNEMGAVPSSSPVAPPARHSYTRVQGAVVPPPQRHSRPRGGGGPRVDIHMGPGNEAGGNQKRVNVTRPEEQNSAHHPGVSEAVDDENQSEMEDEVEARRQIRPIRRKYSIYRQTRPRGSNPQRAVGLNAVRSLMNTLMHIQRDSDVTKVRLADSAEVEQFDIGEGDGPGLDPMRPYFGKHFLKKGWHHTLRSLFIERMQQDYAPFNESEEDNIGDMFDERIGRLRRQWVHQMKMSENDMEREVALRAAQGRSSTRRVTLYDNRREVALGNVKKPDGSIDKGWQATLRLINKLGCQGMSSDESAWEGEGTRRRRVYYIRRRKWRSVETQNRLEIVDANMNTTNAFGRPRCGNAPRERIRLTTGPSIYYQVHEILHEQYEHKR
ncbi:hypothetical protein HYPSUDRAFT_53481 [Hypholoma sublateritium FD-334 SS-4]|uniref:Uncharacterized protein n=1 Tax=Hypholoma sublateritium (strain FD-334 SS-4) TaxID=945553 RepID=A0A0D2Q080_HYPSF|nr:hypothetical protein HYPSUDRAFT_53481 [Hypholoma sublateritium FD-334 SS-4]